MQKFWTIIQNLPISRISPYTFHIGIHTPFLVALPISPAKKRVPPTNLIQAQRKYFYFGHKTVAQNMQIAKWRRNAKKIAVKTNIFIQIIIPDASILGLWGNLLTKRMESSPHQKPQSWKPLSMPWIDKCAILLLLTNPPKLFHPCNNQLEIGDNNLKGSSQSCFRSFLICQVSLSHFQPFLTF